ncbi:MAG: hypothetical protein WD960_02950, partial [Gemmatimonadota bacterium]
MTPARDPPQAELDLDQSPAFDLAAPEAIPEYTSISPFPTTGTPEARGGVYRWSRPWSVVSSV